MNFEINSRKECELQDTFFMNLDLLWSALWKTKISNLSSI